MIGEFVFYNYDNLQLSNENTFQFVKVSFLL